MLLFILKSRLRDEGSRPMCSTLKTRQLRVTFALPMKYGWEV
ncbi:MAG: hypothetical protein ACI8W8_003835 [Rhodothermales bacterium]|jgi:hypothetical protein